MSAVINLAIQQGATFRHQLILKDSLNALYDLTGFGAHLQIRRTIHDSTVIIELSSYNGRIILGGVQGTLELILTDTETNALTGWSNAVYDLEIKAGASSAWTGTGDVIRLINGSVTLSLGVTR